MNPQQQILDPNDGGKSSRKWITVLLGLGLAFASMWGPVATMPTALGAILTLIAMYIGGNVATKWVTGKINGNVLNNSENKPE